MRRFLIILLVLSILLCSCRKIEQPAPETSSDYVSETESISEEIKDTTEAVTTEYTPPLPCLVGLYDDLENNGTYTRLYEWNEPWQSGKDIAVFDVIPSVETELYSKSYKHLWKSEAEKLSDDCPVKPYFVLDYLLNDGSVFSVNISSYSDAEDIIKEGYLEIYLYDDINQEDGQWYYHLTKNTTNENTVISSIKITAGKLIDSVKSITLTAYIEGSSGASVLISNGN